MPRIEQSAFMQYLRAESDEYYGTLLRLRTTLEDWLAYVPSTFPHFTRHTVTHSDAIILQLSSLLFETRSPDSYKLPLTGVEAYILAASAYLHDAGMVVSPAEQASLLASRQWRDWINADPNIAARLDRINAIRSEGNLPADVRHLMADRELRLLLADFVRRVHHDRAVDFMVTHISQLASFDFGTPALRQAIRSVCRGHNLSSTQLDDRINFPDSTDLRGERANIRLLAILLRLGDLLDMDYDRACPLLISAVSPLPHDSLPHWEQYAQILTRSTMPSAIRITARCKTLEQHRLLRDWCQWICDEVRDARNHMAGAPWHGDWNPPRATMGGDDATISIEPVRDAAYIAEEWRFELDELQVISRLIHDINDSDNDFLRELIQNAADATRCQMYSALAAGGQPLPESPTKIPSALRRQHPIKITLSRTMRLNSLTGVDEERQVLTIDDLGVGMDREIIRRYFLQIGRSYYTSPEFRDQYGFIPTSRFGVGFLSVFRASDLVTIETRRGIDGEPLRLSITGPRQYFLTERGRRQDTGTSISVELRTPWRQGDLTRFVEHWCRRLEVPVIVDDLGLTTEIDAETPVYFECPDPLKLVDRFIVRCFPFDASGLEGELYAFAVVDRDGEERWDLYRWYELTYTKDNPGAVHIKYPGGLVCLNGITIQSTSNPLLFPSSTRTERYDIRGRTVSVPLHRYMEPRRREQLFDAELSDQWAPVLTEHMARSRRANGTDGWRYRQSLMGQYFVPSFWRTAPDTITMTRAGAPVSMSWADADELPAFTTDLADQIAAPDVERSDQSDRLLLTYRSVLALCDPCRNALFCRRRVTAVRRTTAGGIEFDWMVGDSSVIDSARHVMLSDWELVDFGDDRCVGLPIHRTTGPNAHILLNASHPLIAWLVRMSDQPGATAMDANHVKECVRRIERLVRHGGSHFYDEFATYLSRLNALLQPDRQVSIPNRRSFTRSAFAASRRDDAE